MLDVRRLALLRELQSRGSLSAVARALNYTPSAISQQISVLEKEVGVPLIRAHSRGVTLTEAGVQLAQRADEVLKILETAEAEVASSAGAVRGRVTVGVLGTVIATVLPRVLSKLAEQYPELVVECIELDPEDALSQVASSMRDIALVDQYPGAPRTHYDHLSYAKICDDPIYACAPRGWQGGALAELRWALVLPETEAAVWALTQCREIGFEPRVHIETSSIMAHCGFVQEGVAAAFLPALILEDRQLEVELLPGFPDTMRRELISVIRTGSEARPAIQAVLTCFREVILDVLSEKLKSHPLLL